MIEKMSYTLFVTFTDEFSKQQTSLSIPKHSVYQNSENENSQCYDDINQIELCLKNVSMYTMYVHA